MRTTPSISSRRWTVQSPPTLSRHYGRKNERRLANTARAGTRCDAPRGAYKEGLRLYEQVLMLCANLARPSEVKDPQRHIILTLTPKDQVDEVAACNEMLKKVIAALRRKCPGIKYVGALGVSRDSGRLHYHFILQFPEALFLWNESFRFRPGQELHFTSYGKEALDHLIGKADREGFGCIDVDMLQCPIAWARYLQNNFLAYHYEHRIEEDKSQRTKFCSRGLFIPRRISFLTPSARKYRKRLKEAAAAICMPDMDAVIDNWGLRWPWYLGWVARNGPGHVFARACKYVVDEMDEWVEREQHSGQSLIAYAIRQMVLAENVQKQHS